MSQVSVGQLTRQVILGGIDITEYVISLPRLPRMKTEWGEIPSFQQLSIVVGSDAKQFDATHTVSFLTGVDIYKMTLVVKQFGVVQWTGTLIDFKADLKSKKTTLIAASSLQQSLNTSGRLDSDLLTPSQAIRNLLLLHGIPVNNASFSKAGSILDDIPARVRVNPDLLEWQGTVADVLSPLLTAAIGRLWQLSDGSIGIDTFRVDESPVIATTLTDNDFQQWPDVIDEGFNELQGYSVKYKFGQTQSTSVTKDIKSMDFSGEQVVTATTQATADYIGSQWVALSNRRYLRLTLRVDRAFTQILKLGYFVQITSTELGMDKFGEILGIDDGDPRWAIVTVRIDKGAS